MIPSKKVLAAFSIGFFLTCSSWTTRAEVKLHGLFTDQMVLQQGASVPIWGWADDGEEVVVEFRQQKLKTTAKNGQWMVRLKELRAGGPDHLKVTGKNAIVLKDVLVGEVWIASGQSNMEWPLSRTHNFSSEIQVASHPQVRLYTVPKLKANEPAKNINAQWRACEPSALSNFSAVAYFFGRDLNQALDVPVGIIHTSWGGSPAEVWIRESFLEASPEYKKDILDRYVMAQKQTDEAIAIWEKEQAAAKKDGTPFNKRRPGGAWKPAELYNGMIAPLIPFAMKGAIWYQGESNAERAHQYRTLFADMIRNWRGDWDQGEFPFLLVQLAPFKPIQAEPGESSWAELREAQLISTKVLPKVGMAVITDVGEERDIHPQKKEPVGARLALAAEKIAYGKNVPYSGPLYKSMGVEGSEVILHFDHVGRGLEARGGELTGFTIAGADKKFHKAKAEIKGKTIVVSCPEIPQPVAVRFGWADYPVVNLWNKDGLPATPFRTDDFPMITFGKK